MKRFALVGLIAAALVAAGCGSNSEKNSYVSDVNKVAATYNVAQKRLTAQATKIKSVSKLADKLDQQAALLDRIARAFDAIDPPKDAAAGHAKLVNGLEVYADEFRAAADDIRKDGNVRKAFDEHIKNSKGAAEYQAGIAQLRSDANIK